MPITVGELLDMPHLQLRLHSGAAGLSRPVSWTHTTDLPDPWRWVAGGELLMTNGMSMPRTASGQERVIRQLVENGAVALAIGEEMYCPSLTRRLATVSDELTFPVMWIAYPMPFVSISRTVAEATLLEQSQRLIRTERIYHALQRISADKTGLEALTAALSKELECPVTVCDRSTGEVWYSRHAELDPSVRDAIATGSGQLRAGVTAVRSDNDTRALLVDVPTHPDAVLVCLPEDTHQPDAILLQHAATVCALALYQTRLTIEHQRRTGAELLAQILDRQLPPVIADRRLTEFGIETSTAVIVAACNDEPERLSDLHVHLWRTQTPHVIGHLAGIAMSVLPDQAPALKTHLDVVGSTGTIGVSNPIGRVERIPDAEREASWALQVAKERHIQVARYAEATRGLGPRTPEEARAVVDGVLGPIIELPPGEADELIRTLRGFLDNQRSWQRTAEALNLHRQTVLYRIRKAEKLIDRQLADTADLAAVWLALEAINLLSQ